MKPFPVQTVPLILSVAVFGCAINSANVSRSTLAEAKPANLTLRISENWEGEPFTLNEVRFRTSGGNTVSVSRLAFLMSGIELLDGEGKWHSFPDAIGYINPEEGKTDVRISSVRPAKYRQIRFKIGVPPKLNHTDPAKFGSDSPLNPLVNKLHWGWQGGYVFLAIEGRYERPGTDLGGYSYHLATDAHLMSVTLPCQWDLRESARAEIGLNLSQVFKGHEISVGLLGESTHSAPGDPLANLICKNMVTAFGDAKLVPGVREVEISTQTDPPHGTHPFRFNIPSGFPTPSLPKDNPLTKEGVELGKKLFVERRLSANGTQSCADCHIERYAWSDGGHPLSVGIDGLKGHRHAMSLANLAWSPSYTWDGRRSKLRDQALAPIQDHREMHQTLTNAVNTLQQQSGYFALFARAFGTNQITPNRIGLALEQYLLTLTSSDSKFDRAVAGKARFSDLEKRGLQLFITEYDPARGKVGADCFHCHGGNLFTDFRFTNNGTDSTFKDKGRAMVTGKDYDMGKFKTPSLRNVAIRRPYMHDGRFTTLRQVIDHYSTGVKRSDTLDPNIAKHPAQGMKLSREAQGALIAFLNTLTDDLFLKKIKVR